MNYYINFPLLSSLFFITNSIHALYNQTYIYALVFAFLTVTSLIRHSIQNLTTYIIDRIAILCVVVCGGYILYKKSKIILNKKLFFEIIIICIIIIAFFTTIFLYKYQCFHHNVNIANLYHSLLHLVGSTGHHLIMFL